MNKICPFMKSDCAMVNCAIYDKNCNMCSFCHIATASDGIAGMLHGLVGDDVKPVMISIDKGDICAEHQDT